MSNFAELIETKVYVDANGQHVTLPPELHLSAGKVFIGRDLATGDIVITQTAPKPKPSWEEFFAALDADPFPEDFMNDRDQGVLEVREPL